jgi:purine nucleosidase
MSRVFLIDTDTASDDSIALIMALGAADVRVAAITTVAGNVNVRQATRNALYTVELCDSDVPVYAGAERPLIRPPHDAVWFHGEDGLGDHNYPPPRRPAQKDHAADAISAIIEAHPGIVLVTLGPLTNVALALAKKPGIVHKVSRCVIMGGAPCGKGNITPVAEYNVWADPEAARMVFHSGLPIELVGWHLCGGDAVLNTSDIKLIAGLSTNLARFAIQSTSRLREAHREQTGEDGITLADPVAMSVAIDPTICSHCSEHLVEVETSSELTRGMTVVDREGKPSDTHGCSGWARLNVCWTIDAARWKTTLYSALEAHSR